MIKNRVDPDIWLNQRLQNNYDYYIQKKRGRKTRWKNRIFELRSHKNKKIQKICQNFQKFWKNPENLPELPKQKSEIKNSLDGFSSGVDTQQTGLMSQKIGQYYISKIKHKEEKKEKEKQKVI